MHDSLSGGPAAGPSSRPSPSAASQPPAAEEAGQAAPTRTPAEKQLMALRKKLKQCEALAEKKAAGKEKLTSVEVEKLAKMPGW